MPLSHEVVNRILFFFAVGEIKVTQSAKKMPSDVTHKTFFTKYAEGVL